MNEHYITVSKLVSLILQQLRYSADYIMAYSCVIQVERQMVRVWQQNQIFHLASLTSNAEIMNLYKFCG